jgi:hypothetical protein
MCHLCAILIANTTEICAGGLINAALRVRAGCCGTSKVQRCNLISILTLFFKIQEVVPAVHAAT